jgi:8-oxo-dGTP pyrophosphatase MutT (NUDIX family)
VPDASATGPATGGWPADAAAEVRWSVAELAPRDGREAEARRSILDALETLGSPLDRDADPVHVTASAVVVGRRGTVLHLHKRLGCWLQPGGHLEPGETPADAACREAREETGLEVVHPEAGPRLLHVDVHPASSGHTHLDLRYLLVAPDEDPAPGPGESPHARWFSWGEAASVADAPLAGALAAAHRAFALDGSQS